MFFWTETKKERADKAGRMKKCAAFSKILTEDETQSGKQTC